MAYEEVKVKTPMILKVLPIITLVVFFGAWELIVYKTEPPTEEMLAKGLTVFESLSYKGFVPDTMLAAPSKVVKLFVDKLTNPNPDGALLHQHAWMSVQEAGIGYLLALLVGLPLGLLMGWFTTVRGLARPIFEMIRPIPPIAWIPLTIFWFGIGLWGKVFIIWIAGIVPCVINAFVGVRMTNPTLIQMARTYGASDWQIFTKICIPSALPMVFGALQIALAYCWVNLVGAELLAADSGLGFLISMGRRLAMPDMVVLGMVSVGIAGAIIGVIIDRIERRLLAGIRR